LEIVQINMLNSHTKFDVFFIVRLQEKKQWKYL